MDIRGSASLETKLAQFPRLGLAQLPTPLEPLKRLSAFLEGPCLWVKRDDTTGLGFGGNKLRKLDYVLHERWPRGPIRSCQAVLSSRIVSARLPLPPQSLASIATLPSTTDGSRLRPRITRGPATPCSIGCLAQRCTTCPGRGIATVPSRHSASAERPSKRWHCEPSAPSPISISLS